MDWIDVRPATGMTTEMQVLSNDESTRLSVLAALDVDELESALRDPGSVPIAKKHEPASRGSYLINAVNRARGR